MALPNDKRSPRPIARADLLFEGAAWWIPASPARSSFEMSATPSRDIKVPRDFLSVNASTLAEAPMTSVQTPLVEVRIVALDTVVNCNPAASA